MIFGIHVILGTFSDDFLFLMSISSISLPRSSVEQEILTGGLKDEEVKMSDVAEDITIDNLNKSQPSQVRRKSELLTAQLLEFCQEINNQGGLLMFESLTPTLSMILTFSSPLSQTTAAGAAPGPWCTQQTWPQALPSPT